MINKEIIPKEILPYLIEIANRLWAGHAAIMIGAGFSKNAKKNSTTKKRFPDWNQLGDVFYEKINGIPPKPKDKAYLNVLKLADEVQAAFGRNTLDQIVKTEVPDKEFQPSILHEKTLRLPWSDIFTTNYDTLLERTAEKILQYRYETVINKEDLVFSTKPRIVKLHGSFPSERPFIITEEDYRKYPIEYAPFVNTVQQSLLENTLCLIGFSGDDPNFLKWIGWIRDNLGKENSPKIFLIGILSLSVGQKRLLEERNIIPIDLSNCHGIDGNHETALTLFMDFITEQGSIEEKLNWPENNQFYRKIESDNKNVNEIIENWKTQRKNYPNWIVLPEDRREVLFMYTEGSTSLIYNISKISAPNDIKLLYEFDWRIKMSLMPIYNDLIKHYESVTDNYNPFIGTFEKSDSLNPKNNPDFNWKEITQYWIELQLSMLRFYREEGFNDKWQKCEEKIGKVISEFNAENIASYHYEKCLYQLFSLDIQEFKKEIENWEINNSIPYWEAKRAGLLAELGEVSKAEKILETSLMTIRERLNLSPVTNDYTLVSQEAYVLQLLKYVKKSLSFSKGEFDTDKSIFKDYSDRWNKLVQFKCDPWTELKSFNAFLEKKPKEYKRTEQKVGFKIGTISTTENLGADTYAQKAYMFLRYIEEIGIPFRIPNSTFGNKAAQNAIPYIANYSPYWGFAAYMRLGDTKEIDSIFGRKALSRITNEMASELIQEYLNILEKARKEIENGDTYKKRNFAISLSTVIPEVISRLCVKSEYKVKIEILNFLEYVYNTDLRYKYNGIRNLFERLMESLSLVEQYNIIPRLIKFPVLSELNHIDEREFLDPFSFLDRELIFLEIKDKITVSDEDIADLLKIAQESTKERVVAVQRLVKLLELKLLNKNQIKLFGDTLWSQCDENTRFPSGTNFYNFAFLSFPFPKSANPDDLLRKYINETEFPVQSNREDKSISMSRGDFPIFHNILGTTNNNIKFKWDENALNILVEKLKKWWDLDKHFLIKEDSDRLFGSIQDEFKARFKNLKSILAYVVAPNFELLNEENKNSVVNIVNELPKYKLHSLEVEVAFPNSIGKEEVFSKLLDNLYSCSESNVRDALQGVLLYINSKYESPIPLVTAVCDNIKCLNDVNLTGNLIVMSDIISSYDGLLEKNHLNSLKIGLSNLLQKVVINSDDSLEKIDYKLRLKIQGAKLSLVLKRYFEKRGNEIPDFIADWKSSCIESNEFSEIKRIWKDE